MKPAVLITLFFISTSTNAQFIDLKLFKINGLSFYSTKERVMEVFGTPDQTYEPNYECGFLSKDEQGKDFYSLVYPGIKFTGNKLDDYLIEEIDLTKNDSILVQFGEYTLNSISTMDELAKILGIVSESEKLTGTMLKVYFEKSDDAILFIFKNGGLIKLDYWSPC